METDPPRLRIFAFATHAARGLIRDRAMRRRVMFFTALAAMVMVFAGEKLLRTVIAPPDHPIWFLLFWVTCGWVTFTALLLAFFDLLLVRRQARAERHRLRGELDKE